MNIWKKCSDNLNYIERQGGEKLKLSRCYSCWVKLECLRSVTTEGQLWHTMEKTCMALEMCRTLFFMWFIRRNLSLYNLLKVMQSVLLWKTSVRSWESDNTSWRPSMFSKVKLVTFTCTLAISKSSLSVKQDNKVVVERLSTADPSLRSTSSFLHAELHLLGHALSLVRFRRQRFRSFR